MCKLRNCIHRPLLLSVSGYKITVALTEQRAFVEVTSAFRVSLPCWECVCVCVFVCLCV